MQEYDERMKQVHELIGCIKLIKMNVWEAPFSESVKKKRRSQYKCQIRYSLLNCVTNILWVITPLMVSMNMFILPVR